MEFRNRQELGLISDSAQFRDEDHFKKMIVPGISHGFMQFVSVFPEGRAYIDECRRFIADVIDDVRDAQEPSSSISNSGSDYFGTRGNTPSRRGSHGSDGERPLEIPSKLQMTQVKVSPMIGGGIQLGSVSPHPRNHRRKGSGGARHPTGGNGVTGKSPRTLKSQKPRRRDGRLSPGEARQFLPRLASSEDLLERRMSVMAPSFTSDDQAAREEDRD
jgi:hypothetical protein